MAKVQTKEPMATVQFKQYVKKNEKQGGLESRVSVSETFVKNNEKTSKNENSKRNYFFVEKLPKPVRSAL